METMYNTSCMAARILDLYPDRPAKGDMAHCVISRSITLRILFEIHDLGPPNFGRVASECKGMLYPRCTVLYCIVGIIIDGILYSRSQSVGNCIKSMMHHIMFKILSLHHFCGQLDSTQSGTVLPVA